MGKGGPAGTKRKGGGSGGGIPRSNESMARSTASPFRLWGAGGRLLSSLTWLRNKLLGNISSLAALEGFLRKIWSEHTTGKGCEEGVVNNSQPILKMARSHSKYCL